MVALEETFTTYKSQCRPMLAHPFAHVEEPSSCVLTSPFCQNGSNPSLRWPVSPSAWLWCNGQDFRPGYRFSYEQAEPVPLKTVELGCTFWDTGCHIRRRYQRETHRRFHSQAQRSRQALHRLQVRLRRLRPNPSNDELA